MTNFTERLCDIEARLAHLEDVLFVEKFGGSDLVTRVERLEDHVFSLRDRIRVLEGADFD